MQKGIRWFDKGESKTQLVSERSTKVRDLMGSKNREKRAVQEKVLKAK